MKFRAPYLAFLRLLCAGISCSRLVLRKVASSVISADELREARRKWRWGRCGRCGSGERGGRGGRGESDGLGGNGGNSGRGGRCGRKRPWERPRRERWARARLWARP